MSIVAMKRALEALERAHSEGMTVIDEIDALRAAIEAAQKVNPATWKPTGTATEQLWEALGRWSAYLASNGGQANLAPPSYLVDAINAETIPQPTQKVEPVGFVEGLFDEDVIEQFGFKRDQAVYFAPQPAIPPGMVLVPTKDTDAAKEIVSRAFNEAMFIQAGELGPITPRQKNAIYAIVWAVIEAMLAAAPKEMK